ncbi:hypothetical protein GCM10010420_55240 [Streptomyces glaucosporus]|uniref:Uncharacterized protein n=1 Tax=Streptomyces glaucosporus TaxID=284044 RepID=A0ABN3J0T2_9ACTN
MPADRWLGAPAQFAHPGAAGPPAPLVVHAQLHSDETGIGDLLSGLPQFRAVLSGAGLRRGPAVRGGRVGSSWSVGEHGRVLLLLYCALLRIDISDKGKATLHSIPL